MNETATQRSGLATIPEACAFLKISRSKIYQMLDKEIPTVKIGRSRRIRWVELIAYEQQLGS